MGKIAFSWSLTVFGDLLGIYASNLNRYFLDLKGFGEGPGFKPDGNIGISKSWAQALPVIFEFLLKTKEGGVALFEITMLPFSQPILNCCCALVYDAKSLIFRFLEFGLERIYLCCQQ